jgi:hypothetical protein
MPGDSRATSRHRPSTANATAAPPDPEVREATRFGSVRRCNPLASPGKVKGFTAMGKKRDDIIVRAGSPFHAEPPSVLASGDTGRSDIARRPPCAASADLPSQMPHHPVAAIGDRHARSRAGSPTRHDGRRMRALDLKPKRRS